MVLIRTCNKVGIQDDHPRRKEEREVGEKKKGWGEEEEKRRERKMGVFISKGR
jgi:hypothetical protein